MPERRYTYGGELQIRQSAGSPSPGTINGPIVVYGDVAPNPWPGNLGPERTLPGAWGRDIERQIWTANLMHNQRMALGGTPTGELRLTDSDTALAAALTLPDTEQGRETAYLARKGVLRGLSAEFDIVNQYKGGDGVRNLVRITGDAVGVVDRPAYGKSQLQIRQAATESTIVAGPAGAGKTQRARIILAELAAQGYEPVAADLQAILAAILLLERQADGRYPERLPDQAYALGTAEFLRTTLIRNALEADRPVVVTISERPTGARYGALLDLFDGQAQQEVIDPGVDEIVRRLSGPGGLSEQCRVAASRWYDAAEIDAAAANRGQRRRMVY